MRRFFKDRKMIFLDEKKNDVFVSFAQNKDCGYKLEQPH